MTNKKTLLAVVGMAGAGKSLVTSYITEHYDFPKVRFGDVTDEELARRGLEFSKDNDRIVRESLRDEYGQAAFAVLSLPKIEKAFGGSSTVIVDGLYSWEEYLYLKERVDKLVLIAVYAPPKVRYERLTKRPTRPLKSPQDAHERDVAELTHLNKGGPIAIADYLVYNVGDVAESYHQVDTLMEEIQGKV